MTRSWHIRDVYHDYLNGKISWEQVVETAELGLVEFEQRCRRLPVAASFDTPND